MTVAAPLGGAKDGESMAVTMGALPAGANEDESTIVGGGGCDVAGGALTTPMGVDCESDVDGVAAGARADDDDGGGASLRSTTVSLVGSGLGGCVPPSRRPPSPAGVSGGAARVCLNLEVFCGMVGPVGGTEGGMGPEVVAAGGGLGGAP